MDVVFAAIDMVEVVVVFADAVVGVFAELQPKEINKPGTIISSTARILGHEALFIIMMCSL
jgi:hypothetical protein